MFRRTFLKAATGAALAGLAGGVRSVAGKHETPVCPTQTPGTDDLDPILDTTTAEWPAGIPKPPHYDRNMELARTLGERMARQMDEKIMRHLTNTNPTGQLSSRPPWRYRQRGWTGRGYWIIVQ